MIMFLLQYIYIDIINYFIEMVKIVAASLNEKDNKNI